MNDKLFELEIKKIMQEYKLLLIEEEYKNEMISINKGDFLKEINRKSGISPEPEVPKEEVPKEELVEPEDESEDDEKTSFIKKSMKTLYRQIVKLTHPDKTMHKNNKKELNNGRD